MLKTKTVLLIATIGLVTSLTGCGGGSNTKSTSPVLVADSASQENTSKSENKETANNVKAFMDFASDIARRVRFPKRADFAKLTMVLVEQYKKDIVNPYTGDTYFTITNRGADYFKYNNFKTSCSIDCVVIDNYSITLKKLDTSEIVYCLNPESKGSVISFIFRDGIYVYQVSENGDKINEESYFLDYLNEN
jgi:hypothetical protein